jgi:hypothetical protein
MKTNKMVILYWTNERGFTGHGEPIELSLAKSWIEWLNKKHPNHKNWIVEV